MQEKYKQVQQCADEPSDPDEFFEREMRKVRDELRMRWYDWFTFPLGALLVYVLLFSFMLFY